jgi:Mg2+ and Co2+ transporter CorA
LAWGFRFSNAGEAEALEDADVLAALESKIDWVWLNFDLSQPGSSATIASLPHVPKGALAMLGSGDERQQLDGFGQSIGGVAIDYEGLNPAAEKHVIPWNFVMTPNAFFSASRSPSHALIRVRCDVLSGRRVHDVLALFHALIHEVANSLSLALNDLGAGLNEMEERSLDHKEIASEILGQSRRRLVRARRQAVPLRGMLIRLLSERPYWFDDDAVAQCQRTVARMEALVDDLEALQERGRTLQDELKAYEAEKTTKRLTVLAMVSALLLPPTFITGVFGMNVSGLPFQETAYGFYFACGLMAASVAAILILLWRLRLI